MVVRDDIRPQRVNSHHRIESVSFVGVLSRVVSRRDPEFLLTTNSLYDLNKYKLDSRKD